MKKLIFSIIFTAASMCAYSNEPIEKLPAIVIDTIYVSSESLVVEYEVFRPFDHVSLTVQSSRNAALSDDKPVLLSGNTGKKKTSIPVGLQTEKKI